MIPVLIRQNFKLLLSLWGAEQLLAIVTDLDTEAEQIYEVVKDQIAAQESTGNKLFTVLAAMYLPFTLTSSLFGMNIADLTRLIFARLSI